MNRPAARDRDPVAALATPEGASGLAVVRLSGEGALRVARRIFRSPALEREGPQPHRAYHGLVVWPERPVDTAPDRAEASGRREAGEAVDEVVALVMLAPRSYTGEDTVDFICHGGRIAPRLVLEACIRGGARPAMPGEFTRRAFLNGKLSLEEAEAVAELVHAEDELAAGAHLRQLRGGLAREIASIEAPLVDLQAELEGSLEFAEEEHVAVASRRVRDTVRAARDRIGALLALAPAGRCLREGVRVALAGAPNAGKSSLLNALVGEERAIVDDEPGTTRDPVTATVLRDGIRFLLSDTAGLRRAAGRVEEAGIARTRWALAEADIVLHLREAANTRGDEDAGIGDTAEATVLEVRTKADLLDPDGPRTENINGNCYYTSAVTLEGVDDLWKAMVESAHQRGLIEAVSLGVALNARHQHKLISCRDDLDSLIATLEQDTPGEEVVASLLSGILAQVGEISGRVHTERLLDRIFSRFCVGK